MPYDRSVADEPEFEDIVIKITWKGKRYYRTYKKTIRLPSGSQDIHATVHYGVKKYFERTVELVEHHGVDNVDIRRARK